MALEGKEGLDHNSPRVQTSYQIPYLSCGFGLARVGSKGTRQREEGRVGGRGWRGGGGT